MVMDFRHGSDLCFCNILWGPLVLRVVPVILVQSCWSWHLVAGGLPVNFSSDTWVGVFGLRLLVISSTIIYWRMYYIGSRPESTILHLNMLWFVIRIFILLYAGSIVVGLVGWEGLGISRFFLVAFRRSRSRLSGANITIITNRIGDIGYLLAIRYIWQSGFSAVWCVSLLLAALTKRSQYPFSSWLPAAMAAPTPVSRLVHSSTLVTAGIFLLLRHGFAGFTLLSLVGSLTMVGGGIVALLGQDAKKIVALSTLSQLGLITYSLAMCSELLTLNHLLVHAYFKRLLFMCVGVLIHSTFGTQESRIGSDMSSPRASLFLGSVSVFSISGLVATSGARSKHMLLDRMGTIGRIITVGLFVVGRVFTIMYRGKLIRVIGGLRSRVSQRGARSVNIPGVGPLLLGMACGYIFYFCSPIATGYLSMHMPSSPTFFVLVFLFIGVGFTGKWVIDRNLWPRLYISARSGSVGAAIYSSSVPGDVAVHKFSSILYGHVRHLLPFSILALLILR